MRSENRRFIFVLLASLIAFVYHAQTFYWVGGSGKFSDPRHWSLKSGGPPVNLIPNAFTDVVFDDNSGVGYIEIDLDKINSARSLKAKSFTNIVQFTGEAQAALNLSGFALPVSTG